MWRYLIILNRKNFLQNIGFLVFDDEDEHIITTGAVVTLTVHLHRENMSNVFSKELGGNNSVTTTNVVDEEINEEQIDDKENREKVFLNLFVF
jgi:hypothetical protein